MPSKTHIRIPKGLPSAIAHNSALIKMAATFLMLKHLDAKGSGCIKNYEQTKVKEQLASAMSISLRTLYVRIDELTCAELAEMKNGHLYLRSYQDLQMYCGVFETGNHYVKLKPGIRLEYQLRALIYRETQRRQTSMIIRKIKSHYDRLRLTDQQALKLAATEMEAIKAAFEQNEDYTPVCRPDVAISHRTLSQWLTCLSHTSGHYWQERLRKLNLISVVDNRKLQSPERARSTSITARENVRYSRPFKQTFVQLPNLQTFINN